jgi:hypothetical protein
MMPTRGVLSSRARRGIRPAIFQTLGERIPRRCAPRDDRWLVLSLFSALLFACSPSPETSASGPRLEADWTGSDTGRIAAPATAEWCDSLRLLEIHALQGDSGFALAIYPGSTLKAGRYPVRPPQQADSAAPKAALALRWFAETAIKGFRGDSGEVRLERSSAGMLSGRFDARLAAVNATDRLTIRGTFQDLRVSSAVRGCTRRPDSSAVDTGVN